MRTALITLAASLIACGGSGKPAPTEADDPPLSEDDQKIRKAQLASCGPLCDRLVDCSIEDLRANKTDEEIAALNVSEIVPVALRECNADCSAKTFSPRQISIVQECVNGPAECSEYLTCLDRASRGGS